MKSILSFCLSFVFFTSLWANVERIRCTYRDDPSSSISIAWDQISGGNPILYFDDKAQDGNISLYAFHAHPDHVVEFKGMNNHFVRLKGLKPNTTYYFTIKDSQGQSREYHFETLPDNPNAKLSIVAGGDSRNFREARQNANRMVAKLRPHFVMFGGDMTGGDTPKEWIHWMNDWQLTISDDNRITPIIATRGNHEYSNRTVVDLFDLPNANAYYSLSIANGLLQVYTLNSLIASGGDQEAWLTRDLKINQNAKWKFAQYHFPIRPHTSKKAERNDQRANWANLFYEYGLTVGIESDAHVVKSTYPIKPSYADGSEEGFIRDDERGTTYIGEGCWGAPLRSNDDDKNWTRASGSFNQFKWMFVDPNGIEIRTVKTDRANLVTALCDSDRFEMPKGIDLWEPASGKVIYIEDKSSKVLAVKKQKMKISNFVVEQGAKACHVKWITSNEPSDIIFDLQRENKDGTFKSIAKISGKGVNEANNTYTYVDNFVSSQSITYRLKTLPKVKKKALNAKMN